MAFYQILSTERHSTGHYITFCPLKGRALFHVSSTERYSGGYFTLFCPLKGTLEGSFCPLKDTQEGTLSCLIYLRGNQEGTFAEFFQTQGHQEGQPCPLLSPSVVSFIVCTLHGVICFMDESMIVNMLYKLK